VEFEPGLGYQTKKVAEDPHLRGSVAAEGEHRGSRVLDELPSGPDAENLAAMHSTIRQASEILVALGDQFLGFVAEIGKSQLDEVAIFGELIMAILMLSQRTAKIECPR
jgi:hypothetical protein